MDARIDMTQLKIRIVLQKNYFSKNLHKKLILVVVVIPPFPVFERATSYFLKEHLHVRFIVGELGNMCKKYEVHKKINAL